MSAEAALKRGSRNVSHRSRAGALALAAGAVFAGAIPARAQIATLDKGHSYFVNNGLQIWGLDQGASSFNYNGLANANFTGVVWSYGQAGKVSQLTTGQKWGKWVNSDSDPATVLDATELSKKSDLLTLQVGDEQQSDLENPNGVTSAWLQSARNGNYFPNQLLYINSFWIQNDTNYASFIGTANPDAISFDSYPFDEPYGSVIYPNNWLSLAGRFRRHALSSYLTFNGNPIGSNTPRPYGLYIQSYAAQENANAATRHPGDVEMRWQQFTAWTMGFSWVDAFHVGSSSGSLFLNGDMTTPWQPRYDQFKETARQGRNLSPALTKLISYGYGPSIVLGSGSGGTAGVPGDWLPFSASNAPPNQQYLTAVSATNPGTKNGGLPGDVYIGFFNPLHASFGDPNGEAYFMITNALGAYLDDENATVADCTQQVTLNFDNNYSGITSLQRMRRSDGQVEIVPLTRTSGNAYQLVFNLEGGTGDLFKYNDGTPFVGLPWTQYWDSDGSATGDNTTTGAGLGGSGTWDSASTRWHNGSTNAAWPGARDAIFMGTAGTVTLGSPQASNSLTFKTTGFTLTGQTLTLAGSFVTTNSGVTATINSSLSGSTGLTKAGPGTLILGGNNTYTGGTTITAGTVRVSSDANLGAAPASLTQDITLNGGTLQFGASFDLNNNRSISVGPSGGTIDTQGFSNPSGYTQANGIFGPGNITKIGAGTFYMNTPAGALNNNWKGNLILKEGTWKITERGGLPYNANNDVVYRPGQITFDGGTLQIAATISVSSLYRGITINAGGGSFDTQNFNFTWGGPVIGSVSTATFTKLGTGTLTLNSAPATGPATYPGNLNINGGTLALAGGTAMGDSAAITLANTAGAVLSVTGNETIGSLAGGGTAGGNVTLGAITLTTGGNNKTTIFGGVISGASGNLTKTGSGNMALTGNNTYGGVTTITGGTLTVGSTGLGNGGANNNVVLDGGILKTSGAVTGSRKITLGAAGGTFDTNGFDSSFGDLDPGNFTKNGAGKLTVRSIDAANIVINAGILALKTRATTGGNHPARMTNLTLVSSAALDLADNDLVVNAGSFSAIRSAVLTGFGNTTGPGILSSTSNGSQILALFDNALVGASQWAGQTISPSAVVGKYTWFGDANFDGQVTGDDYTIIDSNLNTTPAPGLAWLSGDMNLDGLVTGDDYTTIDSNLGSGSGNPLAPSQIQTPVPEPIAPLALLAASALLPRRRARRA